jgi:hypothetical protein
MPGFSNPPRRIDQVEALTVRKILLATAAAITLAALALGASHALPFLRYVLATYFHVREAALRLPAAQQEWRRDFGDPVTRLAAYPGSKDSADAVRLIDLARSAGVDMARPPAGKVPHRESRADRPGVDLELTDRILRAREERARLGRWPEALPDFEPSRLKDARWVYSVSASGELTICLSRELHWEGLSGLVLPLRYQSE